MLIPGRVSTPGCDRGGAFVLAAKDTKDQEEKKESTIVAVLAIYQKIKTRKHHTYLAAPRSREQVVFGMWNYHVILSTLFKGELLLFPALRQHLFLFLATKEHEEHEEKKKITNNKSQITNNIQYTNSKSQTIPNTHMNNGLIPVPDFEVTFTRKPLETNFFIERDLKSSLDLFGILVIVIWNLFVIWNLEFVIYMAVLYICCSTLYSLRPTLKYER